MACGGNDAADNAGYRGGWQLLMRGTDVGHPRLPEKALTREERIARKMRRTNDESYTIPENQFLAWRLSGDARYKAIGEQFLMDDSFFDPLAADQNVLPGLQIGRASCRERVCQCV